MRLTRLRILHTNVAGPFYRVYDYGSPRWLGEEIWRRSYVRYVRTGGLLYRLNWRLAVSF